MKAVVISEDRRMVVTDIPVPPLTPGHVRVRVHRCGVCGTDLHARTSTHWQPGSVLGHEIVGEVDEAAPDVPGWAPGDRVALYHGAPCGKCEMCLSGREYLCLDHLETALGHGVAQGGYAEFIVVPDSLLHAIPDALDYDQAGIAEPLAIAFHGVNKSNVRPGDPVCVLGAGPIGVMTAWALRARGIADIVVIDPNPARRALIPPMGFIALDLEDIEIRLREALGGRAPIAVFECAGHESALSLAVKLAAYNARIVVQGVPYKSVKLSQFLLVQKEVEIVGAASCTPEEMLDAMECLRDGRIDASQIVTTVAPLERTDALFDALLDPAGAELKVLLAPTF